MQQSPCREQPRSVLPAFCRLALRKEQEQPLRGGQSGQATVLKSCSGTSVPYRAYIHRPLRDGCNSRRDIVSLPICNVELKSKKPNKKPYPKELKTYGDHIRQKRLDLNLSQPQVARIINVTTETITNWELNKNEPTITHIPTIISFLGFQPILIENPIKRYRIEKGLTQEKLARILEIDPGTLSRIENV